MPVDTVEVESVSRRGWRLGRLPIPDAVSSESNGSEIFLMLSQNALAALAAELPPMLEEHVAASAAHAFSNAVNRGTSGRTAGLAAGAADFVVVCAWPAEVLPESEVFPPAQPPPETRTIPAMAGIIQRTLNRR